MTKNTILPQPNTKLVNWGVTNLKITTYCPWTLFSLAGLRQTTIYIYTNWEKWWQDIFRNGDSERNQKTENRHKKGFCLLLKSFQVRYFPIHSEKQTTYLQSQYQRPLLSSGIPWYTLQSSEVYSQSYHWRNTNLLQQQTTPFLVRGGRGKVRFLEARKRVGFPEPQNRLYISRLVRQAVPTVAQFCR